MAKRAARENNLAAGTTSVKEFILPINYYRVLSDTVLWLSSMFSKRSKLNLLIEGINKCSLSRIYDIPQKNRRLQGNKGRLFKAHEIAEIDEDVAGGINSLLGTLETRPRARMVEAPDYDDHLYIESKEHSGSEWS